MNEIDKQSIQMIQGITNMADLKVTSITRKAYEIAYNENKTRKEAGLSSSITGVISEAVVEKFGNAKRD